MAAFDTRMSKVRRYQKRPGRVQRRIARKRGFVLLSKPVGFLVDDIKGPLGPDELERAVQWGRFLAGVAGIHAASEQGRRSLRRS